MDHIPLHGAQDHHADLGVTGGGGEGGGFKGMNPAAMCTCT